MSPNYPTIVRMIYWGDMIPLLKYQAERLRDAPPNVESSNEVAPS
jgi:hypothetical protein